jgi:hypothetical protein
MTSRHSELGKRDLDLREQPLCPSLENSPELVAITSAGASFKQADTYLLLKLRDCLCDGGLGEVAFFGCATNARQARNALEQLQMSKADRDGRSFRV